MLNIILAIIFSASISNYTLVSNPLEKEGIEKQEVEVLMSGEEDMMGWTGP